MTEPSIFERLIAREIPADIVFENERVFAFRDIHPQAPVHILVVPKQRHDRIGVVPDSQGALLGELLLSARRVAVDAGLEESGYRIVINNGPDGGETVPHLHLHVLGGRPLDWPPG